MIIKQKRHRSSKITESAEGQDCLIRSPLCNHDPSTTVLAHLNGGGMGTKHSDHIAAYACSECHRLVDGDYQGYSPAVVQTLHYEGIFRTQQHLADIGLIKLK